MNPIHQERWLAVLALIGMLTFATHAFAGGSAENAILIIDPSDPTSMYVGNYYKNARNIPDANVLYMSSAAANYNSFATTTQKAFAGELLRHNVQDHADYVVIAPFSGFYVPYSGEPTGPGSVQTCSTPQRYSLSAAYTLAQSSADFLNVNTTQAPNRFYGDRSSHTAIAFSSNQGYLDGAPSTDPDARKYYIGALLGYTNGPFGNTISDLLTMIDRSVAADGQRNANGTFYFMDNAGDPRNGRARACANTSCTTTAYPATAYNLIFLGYSAAVVAGVLPPSGSTALGVMTGSATLGIPTSTFTLAPGAFADHMTSWGALFDCTQACQTPVSAWIKQGASASDGTIEEPCGAFYEIFPSAFFHYYYAQGLSIGEAYLRSLLWAPTHNLLYGDPLTRAYSHIPNVNVVNPPAGSQSGVITITPSGTTPLGGANISSYDLLVDGVKLASASFGNAFSLDTRTLPDGRHDIRVLAYDDTPARAAGRWMGTLDTLNYSKRTTLRASPTSGDLVQQFSFTYLAVGGPVTEVRLLQNERVLAAATSAAGTLTVYGQNLGAGISNIQLEVLFADGHRARSIPVPVTVSPSGTPAGPAPVAYSYSKFANSHNTFLLELPASFDAAPNAATYTLLNSPTKAAVLQPGSSPSGPSVRKPEGPCGTLSRHQRIARTHARRSKSMRTSS